MVCRDGENYHVYRSCAGLLKGSKAIVQREMGSTLSPTHRGHPNPGANIASTVGLLKHLVAQNEGDAGVHSSQGESHGRERRGNSTPWRESVQLAAASPRGRNVAVLPSTEGARSGGVQNLPASARRTSTAGIAVGVDDPGEGPDATEGSGGQGVAQPGNEHAAEDGSEVLGEVGVGTLGWTQLEYTPTPPKKRNKCANATRQQDRSCAKSNFVARGLGYKKHPRVCGTKSPLTKHEEGEDWVGRWLTAVERVGLDVLLSELVAGVCVGVLDTAGLAKLPSQVHVIPVDEEGRGSRQQDIADGTG